MQQLPNLPQHQASSAWDEVPAMWHRRACPAGWRTLQQHLLRLHPLPRMPIYQQRQTASRTLHQLRQRLDDGSLGSVRRRNDRMPQMQITKTEGVS